MTTPTTQELADDIVAQIASAIGQSIPFLPKAFTHVVAKAFSGVLVLVYKYCAFIALQLFVAHATMRETTFLGRKIRPLVEWGRLIGVGDPIAATRAELALNVTVLNQDGFLRAQTLLVRSETGVIYSVMNDVALDAPVVSVGVRAVSDQSGNGGAGAIGNLDAGDILSFANPPAAVAREAAVADPGSILTASDGETEDAYRARIIRRFQRRPQGGAYADYQIWGEEVAGIANIYPYTGNNPGEVDVYVEATVESSGDPDGLPTLGQLDAVAASIELDGEGLATRRPANAAVNVFPIARTGFDVEVAGLIPDEPETREAIEAGVDEFLRSREPFIVGLSVLPRTDRVTIAAIGGIVDSIAAANGATVTTVEMVQGIAYTLGRGEKAKLNGSITWV